MERRKQDRMETNAHLTCRVPARPCRVVMHDLSHEGCRIELHEMIADLGGTALLELPGAERFPGRVIWVRGNQAGLRFERRLGKPAAVALGLELPDPEPEEPEVVEEPVDSSLPDILRHWMRRLTDRFS